MTTLLAKQKKKSLQTAANSIFFPPDLPTPSRYYLAYSISIETIALKRGHPSNWEILLFHKRGGITATKGEEIQLAFVQFIHQQRAEQQTLVEHHTVCTSCSYKSSVLFWWTYTHPNSASAPKSRLSKYQQRDRKIIAVQSVLQIDSKSNRERNASDMS